MSTQGRFIMKGIEMETQVCSNCEELKSVEEATFITLFGVELMICLDCEMEIQ